MRRLACGSALVTVLMLGPIAAGAELVELAEQDGTIHLTNAPGDPRYQRLGIAPPAPAVLPAAPVPQARPGLAIDSHIREAAQRYGVPEHLVTAVIKVESGFNPRAVSPKGARGLMQLMPATANQLGVRNVFDPAENIDGGVRHLRGLMERFENDLPLALAAYNAGAGAVAQYQGIPPYPETRQYVTRILQIVGAEAPVAPAAGGEEPGRTQIYTFVAEDGATVYTNNPRRPR